MRRVKERPWPNVAHHRPFTLEGVGLKAPFRAACSVLCPCAEDLGPISELTPRVAGPALAVSPQIWASEVGFMGFSCVA